MEKKEEVKEETEKCGCEKGKKLTKALKKVTTEFAILKKFAAFSQYDYKYSKEEI